MSRREPIEWVGQVAVHEPSGASPYYRLKWSEPDGHHGDTTAGRTLSDARTKAEGIDDRLRIAAGPQSVALLTSIRDEYIAQARSPHKNRRPWKNSHKLQIEQGLERMLRGRTQLRAMDLTREVCEAMRAEAGTSNMVSHNTSILRTFITWGRAHQPPYFTPEQAGFIPKGDIDPLPARRGTQAPNRREVVREVGASGEYVTEEDAPSAREVLGLSTALGVAEPKWGALAPELAATCGLRWGEQFQLTASDVHAAGCSRQALPHIHVDWQIDPGARVSAGDPRRCRPKGDKTRMVPIRLTSFTGYALRDELLDRVYETFAEQAGGTNPEALLFPAPRGGLWWYSAFEADRLIPAMRTANWPLVTWTEVRDVWSAKDERYHLRTTERTMAVKPWHSHRHRFARTMVDAGATPGELMALGGWENEETVSQRYYRTGEEHTTRGLARLAALDRATAQAPPAV